MRLTTPNALTRIDADAHTLALRGSRGELFAVSVLDHNLIRVRFYPEGAPRLDRTWTVVDATGTTPLEGRQRDDLSAFPCPPFTTTMQGDVISVQTDALRVDIHTDDLRLVWHDAHGRAFAADLGGRSYAYDRAGRAVFHTMQRRDDEQYYGFGEPAGTLNKHGMRLRLYPCDAVGYNGETSDPLYKHIPFYTTYTPDLDYAYGLFYDNASPTTFDMGKAVDASLRGSFRSYQADDGDVDYYLLAGGDITNVTRMLTTLTGKPALLPAWALGYFGSTMTYTEMPDAQDQLKQFAALCQQHDIPVSAFQMSSGYTTDVEGRRNVFTWNRSRIPDPAAMAADFHAAGIKLLANVKPHILTTHPHYAELAAMGAFITDPDTGAPAQNHYWSGGLNETAPGALLDFTNPLTFDWWKARIKDALLVYGIDAIWNDNNEYQLWDDDALCHGFGTPIRLGMMRPIQTLLMARASHEALREYHPDRIPFVVSRSASPGVARYAQTWSGDNTTSWHTLQWNTPMGLSLSLSGLPNTGHDIGGLFGPQPEPELFVRWVQMGALLPRFTIHSWNSDDTVNEPWMHADVLPIIREWMKFRYALLPYLEALMVRAHETGEPIIRPLVCIAPQDERARAESFDFLLGDLLVAPVYAPDIRARDVYLPTGSRWYDWHSDQVYEGGQTIHADAPLERIPLFARAGARIPLIDEAGAVTVRAFG